MTSVFVITHRKKLYRMGNEKVARLPFSRVLVVFSLVLVSTGLL